MLKFFTPSMIVSMIALTVALSGTAVAAKLITGAQIKDGSIGYVDISKTAKAKLLGSSGAQGLPGPAGAAGVAGAAGAAGGFNMSKISYVTGPTVTVADGDVGSASAFCPAGNKVMGGGFFSSITSVGASANNSAGTSWFVLVFNDTGIPVDIWAFAVCAAP